MQDVEMPEISVLHGDEAIKALQQYIDELEKQDVEGLTENQTRALVKIAQGLISTLEAQKQQHRNEQKIEAPKKNACLPIKKRILKGLINQSHSQTFICTLTPYLPSPLK